MLLAIFLTVNATTQTKAVDALDTIDWTTFVPQGSEYTLKTEGGVNYIDLNHSLAITAENIYIPGKIAIDGVEYITRIGSMEGSGGFKRIKFGSEGAPVYYIGGGDFFQGNNQIISADMTYFDTSKAQGVQSMFMNCPNLLLVTFGEVQADGQYKHFKTAHITSFDYMFYGCSSLKNIDLKGFKTTSAIDMTAMFLGCNMDLLDLSSFEIGNLGGQGLMLGINKQAISATYNEEYAELIYGDGEVADKTNLTQAILQVFYSGDTSYLDVAENTAQMVINTNFKKIIAPKSVDCSIALPKTYCDENAPDTPIYTLTGDNVILVPYKAVSSTGVASDITIIAIALASVVSLIIISAKKKRLAR